MPTVTRRSAIAFTLLGIQNMLSACGGGSDGRVEVSTAGSVSSEASGPASAPAPVWDIALALRLVAGAGSSFDLATTLPAGVAAGGVFKLSASSLPLPTGVTLTSGGLLQAARDASIGSISGIVFTYDEP